VIRPSALLFGAVFAAPALWHGFVTGDLDVTSALLRFVLAVLAGSVLLGVLRAITAGYGHARTAMPADPPETGDRRKAT
jgi:hypothetical protein